MKTYFYGNLASCNSLIGKLDSLLGFPDPTTKTDTYALPIPHDSIAGQFLVILEPVYAPALSRYINISDIDSVAKGREKTDRKDRSVLVNEGAFPIGVTGP